MPLNEELPAGNGFAETFELKPEFANDFMAKMAYAHACKYKLYPHEINYIGAIIQRRTTKGTAVCHSDALEYLKLHGGGEVGVLNMLMYACHVAKRPASELKRVVIELFTDESTGATLASELLSNFSCQLEWKKPLSVMPPNLYRVRYTVFDDIRERIVECKLPQSSALFQSWLDTVCPGRLLSVERLVVQTMELKNVPTITETPASED